VFQEGEGKKKPPKIIQVTELLHATKQCLNFGHQIRITNALFLRGTI